MGKWSRRVQSVGHSVLEVVQAEMHSLLEDFQETSFGAVKAIAILFAAGAFMFWGIGVLIATVAAVLSLWLELWQAILVVFVAIMLVALGLGFWGWSRLKRLEGPAATMRRHVDDHLGWWRDHLSEDERRIEHGRAPRHPRPDDDEEFGS